MGHEAHHHEEKKPLALIASPLHESTAPSHAPPTYEKQRALALASATNIDQMRKTVESSNASIASEDTAPPFENMDYPLHEDPSFHRHAEATTAELFYDLFFVANLTTFTSNQEINSRGSLTDYIGFFSLLWLTWYQVSLFDVRFSVDSVFERIAKTVHFGVMVGFAVIGPQWQPGQPKADYRIYTAFTLMLMVSRFTLFAQYSLTLWYTKKYTKTIIPLCLIMGSTLIAAIIYGSLIAAFPRKLYDASGYAIEQPSIAYIAWYIIGISETILTVGVSSYFTIVSMKGTHIIQRMSLLTLIILGEGIIVICKSISRIVKNNYLWTAPVVGQIIAAVLIIYFLYMLYFDRIQEEHFGTIKQQIWSFLHFPLHTVLVLVLQGISLLIVWRQAVESLNALEVDWLPALNWIEGTDLVPGSRFASYMNAVPSRFPTEGAAYATYLNNTVYGQVFDYIPKGVDASKEIKRVNDAWFAIRTGLDNYLANNDNTTAWTQFDLALNDMTAATFKTLFDTFSVTAPTSARNAADRLEVADWLYTIQQYYNIFNLVFTYAFVAGGVALILLTVLGFISLPQHERRASVYARLAINIAAGLGLSLVALIGYNNTNMYNFLGSAWMIPLICIILFLCVLSQHIAVSKGALPKVHLPKISLPRRLSRV